MTRPQQRQQHDPPVLVTTAGRSPADERRDRERRYLITMGFRVLAIIVALVVATGWIRVIVIAQERRPLRHRRQPRQIER